MPLLRMCVATLVLFGSTGGVVVAPPDTIGGGGSIPERTDPTVCERKDFSGDALGTWFGHLMHTLCKSNDADSLTAAYLLSLPGFGSHGEADERLLKKARSLGKPSPKVLWASIIPTDCASPIGGCKPLARL